MNCNRKKLIKVEEVNNDMDKDDLSWFEWPDSYFSSRRALFVHVYVPVGGDVIGPPAVAHLAVDGDSRVGAVEESPAGEGDEYAVPFECDTIVMS